MTRSDLFAYTPSMDVFADLLRSLVEIPSPSGKEHDVQAFIEGWFAERGVAAVLQPAGDDLVNLIARVEAKAPGPDLLLFGHADTAAAADGWRTDPHRPTRRGNRLHGLGAMDMKAGLATAMLLACRLAREPAGWAGSVTFASFADEEAWSRGARAFLDAGVRADAAILAEPHFPAPSLGALGKTNIEVTVRGRAAHGSFPERGVNAVVEAGKLLAALDELAMAAHPKIGFGSQCVLSIRGGPDTYMIQVPERCSFLINRHLVPGETAAGAAAQVEALALRLDSPATFEVQATEPYYPPFLVPEDDPVVVAFAAAYEDVLREPPTWTYGRGVCDANYLVAEAHVPTVVFGPGGDNMHAANEYADLTQMAAAYEVYARFAEAFLV